MKLLGKILKFLLWCLLALVLLAGLTALAWWMRWPMFTGVFVVAGLGGALLLFFVGRSLWRLRNKRRFVQTALAGLETAAPSETARATPLETRWNALLLHDRSRGKKLIDPRDFIERAWYVALDATGALSPIFAGTKTGWDATQAIARHDFAQTTLLHCQAAALGGPEDAEENREELLTLMARDLKKGALSGIVLLVSAENLLARGEQNLHEEGYALRACLYELMVALNRSLPVVVLVEGLDRLPGGDAFFARPGVAESWPGCFFAESTACPGQEAATTAEAALRERFYDALVSGLPAAKDELACLEDVRALGEKLDMLFASLLEEAPRHDPILLSGVFFCPSGAGAADPVPAPDAAPETAGPESARTVPGASPGHADRNLPHTVPHAVLARFFSRTLPAGGAPARSLTGRFAAYATGWIVGVGAWFLLLIAICGLMAAGTLYQKRALATAPQDVGTLAHASPELAALYRQLHYIEQLDDAERRWLLPSFGINAIGDVAREEKAEFTRHLYGKFLPSLVGNLQRILDGVKTEGYTERQHAALTQLSWLSNAVSERLEKGRTTAPNIFFPLTNQDGWNTAGSEIIRAGLNWTQNPEQLRLLSEETGNIVARFLSDHFPVFSESVVEYYNNTNADRQICLSQYWPHLTVNGEEDFCIPAYYTAASYELNSVFFGQFLAPSRGTDGSMARFMDDRHAVSDARIRRMFDAYLKRYAEYWQTFAQRFSAIAVSIEEDHVYAPFLTARNLSQTPHLRLIQRMDRELAPLKNANPPPPWLEDAQLFEVMYAVALEGHAEADPAAWHTLLVAGTRMPDVLKSLWEKADNREHMQAIYDGIMGMTLYLSSVREILNTLENPARSLSLARAHFGGKDAETLQKSPYTQAKDRLATALMLFDNSDLPQKQVFRSLLDFAGHGIAVKTALALQDDWETKVLSSPVTRYRSDDSGKMYGSDGIVTAFVNTEAAPFLQFRANGITAASWDGHVFPFTEDFLAFLHHSEEWAVFMSSSATAEESVLMRSSPPVVNVDAKSRPNSVTFTLFCGDKNWQIINRNYPRSERLIFDKTKCGGVDIAIAFPSFEATKHYRDFIAFLEDFQYGEKDFVPEDFPEAKGMLEEANVKTLKLRLIPDGAGRLLQEESEKAPLVPELITYVRE
jgi:hypothetical protein